MFVMYNISCLWAPAYQICPFLLLIWYDLMVQEDKAPDRARDIRKAIVSQLVSCYWMNASPRVEDSELRPKQD